MKLGIQLIFIVLYDNEAGRCAAEGLHTSEIYRRLCVVVKENVLATFYGI
jgi:hypothetical protein